VRAVFFDLDDTLVERQQAVVAACRGFLTTRGLPLDGLRVAAPRDKGGGGDRGDLAEVAAAMARGYPHLGMPVDAIARELRRMELAGLETGPGVPELIEELRRKHRLALVTNGSGEVQRAKLARTGLSEAFDVVVIAGEVGSRKPESEIWKQALELCECGADEALMVGDDPINDIDGAAAAGLATCWISRGRKFPTRLRRPTHVCPQVVGVRWVV